MRIVLVDDEELSLENLEFELARYKDIKVVGRFRNGKDCLTSLEILEPDVLLTDISMPEMDGIELASKAQELFPDMIIAFLTSYDTYALKSYEIGAFDYILKPFTEERLKRFVNRAAVKIRQERPAETIDTSDKGKKDFGLKNFISVSKEDSIIVVNKKDVIYSCSQDKKTLIYTQEGCFRSRHTLESLEEILGNDDFIRCHRGFLVNIHHVREIYPMFNQTYMIKLKNSHAEVPVSRNHAVKLKRLLGF